MRRRVFFLLALLCGLIAAGSIYIYLQDLSKNHPTQLKPLVMTKTAIAARSVITANQLEIRNVPSEGYPKGGYSSIQNVTGSIALINLAAGDLVLSPMIEQQSSQNQSGTGSPTSLTVPEGKRAVAIPITLVSGVGYAVKPSDHVDVLVTMDIKDPSGTTTQSVTSLAAQDVLVLSVGESQAGDKTKTEVKAYTLAMSVPQAMAVTYGSEKGSLRLLLRNPGNTEIRQDPPVTGNVFLDPNYIDRYK